MSITPEDIPLPPGLKNFVKNNYMPFINSHNVFTSYQISNGHHLFPRWKQVKRNHDEAFRDESDNDGDDEGDTESATKFRRANYGQQTVRNCEDLYLPLPPHRLAESRRRFYTERSIGMEQLNYIRKLEEKHELNGYGTEESKEKDVKPSKPKGNEPRNCFELPSLSKLYRKGGYYLDPKGNKILITKNLFKNVPKELLEPSSSDSDEASCSSKSTNSKEKTGNASSSSSSSDDDDDAVAVPDSNLINSKKSESKNDNDL